MGVLDELADAVDDIDDQLRALVQVRDAYTVLVDLAGAVPRHPLVDLDDVERQLDDPVDRARWHNAITAIADHLDHDPIPTQQGATP